ncbi:MAG TPA: FoF1 ATP synthase subunit a [Anaerolineales bacterium]|nr:FoF1 ATP synthase subunit a [Anaerolineales bacterium]
MSDHETHAKRIPVKRWIVLASILLGVYFAFLGPTFLRPVSPAVVLPGEPTGLAIAGFPITNTLLATFVADLALIAMAFGAWRFAASGKLAPSGFYNFTEVLIEFLWNAAESTAGKWARKIFPFTATIFLLVFAANMTKLVPGFESIGRLEQAHGQVKGYAPVHLFGPLYTIDKGQPVEHAAEGEAAAEGEHSDGLCTSCEVIPYLRGAPTDLNFTFALAVAAVVLIQVFGVWALGASYFGKFINTKTMFTVPMFGVIDFGVGILELVSEFAKILSFGFRLFGNIFAGALLISILGALTAVIVPTGLYLLEVFIGLIQAYVFSTLALVFISQATISHHGGEEHH